MNVVLTGFAIIAGIAAVWFLYGCFAGIALPGIFRPKGARCRGFDQVRREQTVLGGVDYGAYDQSQKENFSVERDSIEIRGEFISAPATAAARRKCIIRAHGYTQNRLISVRYIKVFQEMGYDAVIYDQRCFGESGGSICTMGREESRDLSEIITWVKRRLGDDALIGVHGESMGAVTALLALGRDKRIDFAVADAAPSEMRRTAAYQLQVQYGLPPFPAMPIAEIIMKKQYGFGFDDIRPADSVPLSEKPVFFIHGGRDRDVPVEMCGELFLAAKNPLSRMAVFPGAGHCWSHAKYTTRYEALLRQFIRDVEASLATPAGAVEQTGV